MANCADDYRKRAIEGLRAANDSAIMRSTNNCFHRFLDAECILQGHEKNEGGNN